MSASLETLYAARRIASLAERDRRDRQSLIFSAARFLIFACAVALVYAATRAASIPAVVAWPIGAVLVASFLVVMARHEHVERAKQAAAARAQLCDEAVARIARRWDEMPPARAALGCGPYTSPPHSSPRSTSPGTQGRAVLAASLQLAHDVDLLAHDLDLLGHASLGHLLGRTATPGGAERLASWMQAATTGHVEPTEIAARQAAIRELAPLLDFRLALVSDAMVGDPLAPHATGIVDGWIAAPPSPASRPWMVLVALAIPLASVAVAAGMVPQAGSLAATLSIPLVAWGVRYALATPIGRAFAAADALSGEGRRYLAMIRAWEAFEPTTPRLVALRARLRRSPRTASAEFARLKRLIDLADLRWSHLPHFFIHSATGWDLHVAAALERWKRSAGPHVAEWFDALAELDALATLAGLAHDEPGWSDPVIDAARDRVAASAIGHPLLASAVRVANDVEVGPAGTSLVVTGSNMSGKSTLLRALGLNVVLAQMGAPVCATSLHLPPLQLETSIRITDSLSDGVSYFMSALLRLKAIVSAADAMQHRQGPVVCYLLDEVLQGTNSEERQIAVRRIFAHLVATRAIGAMTTHDLHLVHAPEFVAHARHVHFTEHVTEGAGSPTITFDYRLRPGPATSRNALALMRMVGLDA